MRLLLVFLFAVLPVVAAAETTVSSGPERTSLIELYTSEGCSSCPPADESLSRLLDADDLWREFVPVAFHVTYWDKLGWEDRFAASRYDRRQRAYTSKWGHGVVYTPGFVIDGREWRDQNAQRGLETKAREDQNQGVLEARVTGNKVTVNYDRGPSETMAAHAAVLGFGLTTDVEAGENANRTLRHDFVALDYARGRPTRDGDSREAVLELSVKDADAQRLAIAVWVSGTDEPGPIQAAGGWLTN